MIIRHKVSSLEFEASISRRRTSGFFFMAVGYEGSLQLEDLELIRATDQERRMLKEAGFAMSGLY